MRMRKKPNLAPRMERCSAVQVTKPETLKGRWLEQFAGYSELRLEIGCGKGRFTAETARLEPGVLFAAIEKVPDAMVVAMERVCGENIRNVRFADVDASLLCELFEPSEVSRIYINFPDPWPKAKRAKRRLTFGAFLKMYKRVLVPGGELWFKTDNAPLFDFSLESFYAEGLEVKEITRDLHRNGPVGIMTDYEAKFYTEGKPICRCVAKFI